MMQCFKPVDGQLENTKVFDNRAGQGFNVMAALVMTMMFLGKQVIGR